MGGSLRRNNGGNRVGPYGFKLLLAFGAALLGVLVIHKLRERRIFNLLVKEKDRELSSLQLLLQKEQGHTQDMKKKNDELKANLFSLRTQKMDLERKLVEMQSTISSLRDEGKILESALQEKQTEIKLLRETNANTEEVNQEETETEDLKHRPENSVKMRSVSTDEGSMSNMTQTTNIDAGDIKEEHSPLLELKEDKGEISIKANGSRTKSIDLGKNENYRTGEGSQKVVRVDGREASGEGHFRMLGKSFEDFKHGPDKGVVIVDDNRENRYEFAQSNIASSAEELKEVQPINTSTEVRKPRALDGDLSTTNGEDYKVNSIGKAELNNYQKENHDQQETSKGGKKLEMTDNSRKVASRRKGKYLHVRENGKRWKILARNRWPEKIRNLEIENDGAGRSRRRVGSKEHQGGLTDAEEVDSAAGKTVGVIAGSKHLVELKRPVNSSESQVPENRRPESYVGTKDTIATIVEDDASYSTHKLNQFQEIPHVSGNSEGSTDESLDGKTHNNTKENENHSQEVSEHQKRDSLLLKEESAQEKTMKDTMEDKRAINKNVSFWTQTKRLTQLQKILTKSQYLTRKKEKKNIGRNQRILNSS